MSDLLLEEIVQAWEILPTGFHTPSDVEDWLVEDMKPVIDHIRKYLEEAKLRY